jgi:hypothetical protein
MGLYAGAHGATGCFTWGAMVRVVGTQHEDTPDRYRYACAIAVTAALLYGGTHSAPQSGTAYICVCVPGPSAVHCACSLPVHVSPHVHLAPAGYVEDVNRGGACVDVGRTDLTWVKVLDPATGRVTHVNW